MKRFTTLAIFIALVSIAFAQTHMYVWKNGVKTNYVISEVDSITFGEEKGIGVFSVGENKKVAFSPGNLQYHPKNNEWHFAESQWDYIGDANSNISPNYDGWIDLFGWSTDGNLETQYGVSYSMDNNNYQGTFFDWGNNNIEIYVSNTWYTLNSDEWTYLIYYRTNAEHLHGIAQVNGVNGFILLPDNWSCPNSISFSSGFDDKYDSQTFTIEEWYQMEVFGAVFLPAAGWRIGTNVDSAQNYGYYWTASEEGYKYADNLTFHAGWAGISANGRCVGYSVRLVKDVVTE